MGFVGGVIAALFLFIMFLAFVAFVGIVIIVISAIKRRKARKEGRKPKNAGLVTGLVMLSLPVNVVLLLVVLTTTTEIKKQIKRQSYTCYMDKWRNEYVLESTAGPEVIDEFLKAADKGDKETIKLLFSQTIQADSDFDTQLDEFMEEYPGGLSETEYEVENGGSGGGSDEEGMWNSFGASCIITTDENTYFISVSAVNEDTANPENVGLESLSIYSKEAEVLDNEYDYYDGEDEDFYLRSRIEVSEDINVRVINDYSWEYTEIDRTITEEQARESLKGAVHLVSVEAKLGEPNVKSNSHGKAYFELTQESDEDPIYLYIGYDGDSGEIWWAKLVYSDGTMVGDLMDENSTDSE